MRGRLNPTLTGSTAVDIYDYDCDVHNYLIKKGAIPYEERLPVSSLNEVFTNLAFQNTKPVKFYSLRESPSARIFFPSNDDALVFSIAFGHKIFNTTCKEIRKMLEEQ